MGSGFKQIYSSVNSWIFCVFAWIYLFLKYTLYCLKSFNSLIFLTQSPLFYWVLLWYWYWYRLEIWPLPKQFCLLVLYFNTIQAVLFICASCIPCWFVIIIIIIYFQVSTITIALQTTKYSLDILNLSSRFFSNKNL